jgi:hypothetical protein
MNKILSLFLSLLAAGMAFGHDHVEVDEHSGHLRLHGPTNQTALFVPRGEPFSFYLPDFPGGWHASELTFTTELEGDDLWIELVSVQGPAGGNFAFWEVGATTPTWSRAAGWDSAQGGIPSFAVIVNGDGHTHGRCFTMDKPGLYTVVFRAVDAADEFAASTSKTITFVAQQPPKLSIAVAGGNASLSFTSRANLVYNLQVCTDLESGEWDNVNPYTFMDGDGGVIPMTDTVAGRLRAFYRLVEYQ